MTHLTVRKIGNSFGVILPQEVLAQLNVTIGDQLTVVPNELGVTLTPYDQTFAEQYALAEELMRKHRNVLRELAK